MNLLPSNFSSFWKQLVLEKNRTTRVSATSTVQTSFQKPLQLNNTEPELKSELIPVQTQPSEETKQLLTAKDRWGQATQQIQKEKC